MGYNPNNRYMGPSMAGGLLQQSLQRRWQVDDRNQGRSWQREDEQRRRAWSQQDEQARKLDEEKRRDKEAGQLVKGFRQLWEASPQLQQVMPIGDFNDLSPNQIKGIVDGLAVLSQQEELRHRQAAEARAAEQHQVGMQQLQQGQASDAAMVAAIRQFGGGAPDPTVQSMATAGADPRLAGAVTDLVKLERVTGGQYPPEAVPAMMKRSYGPTFTAEDIAAVTGLTRQVLAGEPASYGAPAAPAAPTAPSGGGMGAMIREYFQEGGSASAPAFSQLLGVAQQQWRPSLVDQPGGGSALMTSPGSAVPWVKPRPAMPTVGSTQGGLVFRGQVGANGQPVYSFPPADPYTGERSWPGGGGAAPAAKLMTRAEFVADFEQEEGRKPTAQEIEQLHGVAWR